MKLYGLFIGFKKVIITLLNLCRFCDQGQIKTTEDCIYLKCDGTPFPIPTLDSNSSQTVISTLGSTNNVFFYDICIDTFILKFQILLK